MMTNLQRVEAWATEWDTCSAFGAAVAMAKLLDEAESRGAERERAAVVAWLQGAQVISYTSFGPLIAEGVRNGEHREEKR